MAGAPRSIGLFLSDSDDQISLRKAFQGLGYDVRIGTHSSSDAGVARDASLLVCDAGAAETVGDALLRFARTQGGRFIPVVLALYGDRDAAPLLRRGFDDVLRFPMSRDELEARLNLFSRLRDQSDRLEEARGAAESADRVKSVLLSNLSHELRTPLTGIIGFTSHLKHRVGPGERTYVELIERSGRRLMETLEAVLSLARLEAGRFQPTLEVVRVAGEVAALVDGFEERAAEKGLGLALEVDDNARSVRARLDRRALDSILQHLIGNAIKFTVDGWIHVHVYVQNGRVAISITDTGVGMSHEFIQESFDAFRQESSGLARAYGGSGVGLSIAKALAEEMHGTIHAESRKDEGSTFTVTFPQYVHHALAI